MSDFWMHDIAVRSRRTAAILDDAARFEVVDSPATEIIDVLSGLHGHVEHIHALHTERTNAAVLRELCVGEHELFLQFRTDRIEATHRGIFRRSRCDDRTAHQSFFHDAMEVAGGPWGVGDIGRIRPQ